MDVPKEEYDVGVIVGRFQVPTLHTGHRSLINHVTKNHDKVVIILGVSPVLNTLNNPLDYEARAQMIQEAYPNIVVLPLLDQQNDSLWSSSLDRLLDNI